MRQVEINRKENRNGFVLYFLSCQTADRRLTQGHRMSIHKKDPTKYLMAAESSVGTYTHLSHSTHHFLLL